MSILTRLGFPEGVSRWMFTARSVAKDNIILTNIVLHWLNTAVNDAGGWGCTDSQSIEFLQYIFSDAVSRSFILASLNVAWQVESDSHRSDQSAGLCWASQSSCDQILLEQCVQSSLAYPCSSVRKGWQINHVLSKKDAGSMSVSVASCK